MIFAAAPLLDGAGHIVGARGLGIDLSEQEGQEAQMAATLRRGELLDHILWCMRQEVLAPRMMRAVLEAMVSALGAEGAAVIDALASLGLEYPEVSAEKRKELAAAKRVLLRGG